MNAEESTQPSAYVKDLVDHKRRVAASLQLIANDLIGRATEHDNSKFSPEEYGPYEEAFPTLQKYPYGSEEFKAALNTIKPAIEHHYQANDHHPEHFPNGVNDMTLVQLVEMVFDWTAASERSQTNLERGLQINKERFHIDDQLFKVLMNTIKWYAPQKLVVTDPLI